MSKRSSLDELFKGRHVLAEVIVVSVRWYLEYKLSSRDISRLMAEREINVDHSTILRWVRRYAEKKWHRYARLIGPSWRVDETYVKGWRHMDVSLSRRVDKSGKSTVSHLSRKRTVGAAKTYLGKATRAHTRWPHTVTLDGYAASHRAVRKNSPSTRRGDRSRSAPSKYLNNLIEQDHRAIKSRIGPMLGFKDFVSAQITLAGR
jgi:transposase-like protein